MQYTVLFEKGLTGYGASVPDLPGCVALGDTLEEVQSLIKGAIEMHLHGMREDGNAISAPSTTAGVIEVAA